MTLIEQIDLHLAELAAQEPYPSDFIERSARSNYSIYDQDFDIDDDIWEN